MRLDESEKSGGAVIQSGLKRAVERGWQRCQIFWRNQPPRGRSLGLTQRDADAIHAVVARGPGGGSGGGEGVVGAGRGGQGGGLAGGEGDRNCFWMNRTDAPTAEARGGNRQRFGRKVAVGLSENGSGLAVKRDIAGLKRGMDGVG